MAFGNILVVYETDNLLQLQVEAVIQSFNMDYERFENSFFILTHSKTKTARMVDAVQAIPVEFGFFHNANPDNSYFRCQGIDHVKEAEIERILGTA
jgi:hypothetical protein